MFLKSWNDNLARWIHGTSTPKESSSVTSIGGVKYSSSTIYGASYSRNDTSSVKSLMTNVPTSPAANFVDGNTKGAPTGVVFGSGNVAPTKDDITLSGSIVSNFAVAYSFNAMYDEDGVTFSCLYTITNNNDTDITIGEVALCATIANQKQQYYDTYYYPYLLERTALETPITIPADGVGQVTYTIRMNYPTA